jgi:hypothetical protein
MVLRFLGTPLRACDGWSRRDLLQVGGLGALGLTLTGISGSVEAASPQTGFGRARACLLIYLFGGPSHIDMWDMKPDAPEGFRGEFRPIATNVPGIRICEHLPRLSRLADRYCLIRGMTHPHPRHGWGLYYMLTGKRHSRPDLDAPPTPDDFPGLGALVSKLGAKRKRSAPVAVTLPRWNRFLDLPNDYAGEKAGFLGSGHDPWLVRALADGQSFSLSELELPLDVPPGRLTAAACSLLSMSASRAGPRRRASTMRCKVGLTTCSVPALCAPPSTWNANRAACAIAMAGIPSAKDCSWPGGWSKRAACWCS